MLTFIRIDTSKKTTMPCQEVKKSSNEGWDEPQMPEKTWSQKKKNDFYSRSLKEISDKTKLFLRQ